MIEVTNFNADIDLEDGLREVVCPSCTATCSCSCDDNSGSRHNTKAVKAYNQYHPNQQ